MRVYRLNFPHPSVNHQEILSDFKKSVKLLRSPFKKSLLGALVQRRLKTVQKILKIDPIKHLGSKKTPLLNIAILEGSITVITYLIDNGHRLRVGDQEGTTALHLAVWNWQSSYFRWLDRDMDFEGDQCCGCRTKRHRWNVVELILDSFDPEELFQNIFLDTNARGLTPFLHSCAAGCDTAVTRYLSMLEQRKSDVQVDKFTDKYGNNAFHHILEGAAVYRPMSASRLDTVQMMFRVIPGASMLINARNNEGKVPLQLLIDTYYQDRAVVIDLVKVLLENGAQPEPIYFLAVKMAMKTRSNLLETLLRGGCHPNLADEEGKSAIRHVMEHWKPQSDHPGSHSDKATQIMELLLAFGFDLTKEHYLNTNEKSIDFAPDQSIHSDILQEMMRLRRSDKVPTLQRSCRLVIRQYLKGRADRVIGDLTCIPPPVKSFLLVENEKPVIWAGIEEN